YVLLFHCTCPSSFLSLSLHDALPISRDLCGCCGKPPRNRIGRPRRRGTSARPAGCRACRTCPSHSSARLPSSAPACRRRARSNRSEEHTSELQSRFDLVCRLLLEKKK